LSKVGNPPTTAVLKAIELTTSSFKKPSASKRSRLLRRIKRTARRAFGDAKRGPFFQKERAAAVLYKQETRQSWRALEDELKDSVLRRRLGLRQIISKSALQRAPLLLGAQGRRALLRASVKPGKNRRIGVDSTGVSTTRYARWSNDKNTRRAARYRKLHGAIDARTRQFLAVRVTKGTRNDSKFFKPIFAEAKRHDVREVAGDSGYPSRKNAQQVENAGAIPFLKPKKNARSRSFGAPAWRRMVYAFQTRPDAWLSRYRKPRSAVEAGWSSLKRVYGAALRAVRWPNQRAELELRAVAYNLRVLTM